MPGVQHKLEQYWDNPDKFDPDRWDTDKVKQRNQFIYIPFLRSLLLNPSDASVGAHQCIGNRFALLEMKLALFHFVSKFKLNLVPGTCLDFIDFWKGSS